MTIARKKNRCWVIAALALSVPAAGAVEPRSAAPPAFSVHDVNQDGYLDRAEYERLRAECLARRSGRGHRPCALEFSAMDADGDGRIDEQELTAALEHAPFRYRHRGGAQALPDEPKPAAGNAR